MCTVYPNKIRFNAQVRVIVFIFGIVCSNHLIAADRFKLHGQLNVDAAYTSGDEESWLEAGKLGLRYGSGSQLNLASLGIASRYGINNSSLLHLESIIQHDDDLQIGVTQSYFLYRPLQKSSWKHQLKIGMFYGPWSFENTDLLWLSPYSVSFSSINSWLAEEVRTLGAEWRWTKPYKRHNGNWSWIGHFGVFGFNDTAGTLLSWRGWSNHDRQTSIGESLPLQELPSFSDDGEFFEQADDTKPFVEIDNRPGFYFGGEAKYRRGIKLRYSYYDNRADPKIIKSGLYAWHTRFHLIGIEYPFLQRFKFISQVMKGKTEMGRDSAWVYNDYNAAYAMVSFKRGHHRFIVRYDDFEVVDKDTTFEDTNDEQGFAWVLGYNYKINKQFLLQTQYTFWESDRPGRGYFNRPSLIRENQWLARLKYRW